MKDNLPDIKKEGIFSRIKKSLQSLFGIGEIVEDLESAKKEILQEPKTYIDDKKNIENEKNNFRESIKFESDKDRLLAMQRKIENGEVKISDLSNDELDKMIAAYKIQHEYKKEKVKKLKEKLEIDTKEG